MKHTIFTLILLASGLVAAPIIELGPTNGQITGAAGSTVGWGFSLTPDPNLWVSVIGSVLLTETDPSLGLYTDFIGTLGGPVSFATPAGGATWTLSFKNATSEGVGSFEIASNAAVGAVNSGKLRISVEYFTGNPFTCGSCAAGSEDFDLEYQITVTEPPAGEIPEPSTYALCGLTLSLGWYLRKRS